jgi:hypothetical protein
MFPKSKTANRAMAKVMWLVATLIFLSTYASAQDQENLRPVVVRFDKGSFEFRNMRLEFPAMLDPEINGEIVNHTGTDWPNIEFLFHIKGFQYKQVPAPGAFIGKYGASSYVLVPDKSKPVEYKVFLGFQDGVVGDHQEFTLYNIHDDSYRVSEFQLTGLDITITKHVSREEVLQAKKEALQKAEEQRQAAAAQAASERNAALARVEARRRELARYSKLVYGTQSVPVAADEKCLEETVDALNNGGLEGRKKLPELLQYRCIFTVNNNTPVRIVKKMGNSTFVTVMDGDHQGESGWVLSEWVK